VRSLLPELKSNALAARDVESSHNVPTYIAGSTEGGQVRSRGGVIAPWNGHEKSKARE